jgi:predicted Zn-dependent protease with MMP-like domain
MPTDEFERLVAEEFPDAIPESFRGRVRNVAMLIEDEPSDELRRQEGLGPHETLLGHYRGIPQTARGDSYGMGVTLPDTITLFRIPLMMEAQELLEEGKEQTVEAAMRLAIRHTIWHEVAHHFGMDEREVREREADRGI